MQKRRDSYRMLVAAALPSDKAATPSAHSAVVPFDQALESADNLSILRDEIAVFRQERTEAEKVTRFFGGYIHIMRDFSGVRHSSVVAPRVFRGRYSFAFD